MKINVLTKNLFLPLGCCAGLLMSSCHTPVYTAAKHGDTERVYLELQRGADPDMGAHPAHMTWAVPTGCVTFTLDVAQVSLMIGTFGGYYFIWGDTNPFLTAQLVKFFKTTPMDIAQERRKYPAMCELYLAGAKATDDEIIKMTAYAAGCGDAQLLTRLVGRGVIVNRNCADEWSPLMQAVGNGHAECARILMRCGDRLNTEYVIKGETVNCYTAALRKNRLDLYNSLRSYNPRIVYTPSAARPARKTATPSRSSASKEVSRPAPVIITPDQR